MTHSTMLTRCLLVFVCTFLLLPIVGCPDPPVPMIEGGDDSFQSTASIILSIDSANALGLPAFVDTLFLSSAVIPTNPDDLPGGIQRGADAKVVRQDQVGTTIKTELVSLELKGDSRMGPVSVRAGSEQGLPPSMGQITDVVSRLNNSGNAELVSGNSFFDMNVLIEVGGIVLSNCQSLEEGLCENPIRLGAIEIDHLPPCGQPYLPYPQAGASTPIYGPGGQVVGRIEHAEHVPEPGCCQVRDDACASPVSEDQCRQLGGTFNIGQTCNITTGKCQNC